ncbi:LOW QUALITY PROTEIN: integrator complex subunit 6 [Plectropomus leopardus]|uniref:LOW QUALITY PROTEIN: integrator complex subunit 6 n=2 Tax=Plectropomus leopardus TaxID=160734 RepID=UPI001C4BAFC3|nr:LOW QUALITY PROTEIN: integrator complex subunit 6 [Plectropomus leopardus]
MPVLLFLIDTSASMNQRTHLGTTYLDIAKGAVETFMKLRGRDPASRGDRYMLVNFEDVPFGIKAGWKESHATFMTELRNLQAAGLTSIGQSLRTAFDLLNLNRLVTGIDNYGQGRNPFFLEPAIIIAITDGNKLTSGGGVQDELHLPLTTPLPGSELTKEPFRWDQRLFALVLRIPGNASVEPEPLGGVPPDDSPITPMCEVTGGRSYSVFSQRMLNQCLESLVQKIQSGVVINFEKTGPDPPPLEDAPVEAVKSGPQAWHCCHKLIYVRPNPKTGVPIGHWPIPEAFWPDQNSPTLPPRSAHPHVRFSCLDAEPMVIDKVPFDKYELEPSPLTQYILERKSPHTCWQVFVCNSAKYSDLGQPFGYLKASTALNCVNLFVMPYNYPVLLPLLDDLIKVHKFKPTIKWRQSFENYLKTMPPYYIGSLRKALRIMGAPNLLADNMEYGLSYSVVSYLKKLSQQSKIEYDRLIALIGKKQPPEAGIKVRWRGGGISLAQRRDFIQQLQSLSGEAPTLPLELNPKEFQGFQLALLNKGLKPQSFRNPYDIPRSHLLDQLSRMRRNLLNTSVCTLRGQDSDQLHSVPIAQMGNYQDFLKAAPQPLRDADPEQPKRLHTFGNPFKLDKKGMMIDEADEFVTGTQSKGKRPGDSSNMTGGGPKRRRCMSPLLRLGRAYTPPVTPPASPRPTDMDDGAPEPDLIINHLNQNHYGSDGSSDSEVDHPLGPADHQENHTATDPDDLRHGDEEEENGQPRAGELAPGSEGGAEMVLVDDQLPRYLSPAALKKHIHIETTKVNNELRTLITKEIRKPGRHYEKIFLLLKQIQGTLDTRLIFLQNIIKEAARFKKRVLIEQLENLLEEIHNRSNNMNHVDTL